MPSDAFVEVECTQICKSGMHVCGDSFRSQRIESENRIIATLADGLGSGVKANILATMTATMAQQFSAANRDIHRFSRVMQESLPICRVRKIAYSTFTIVDSVIEEHVRIAELGNPPYFLFRNDVEVPVPREVLPGETQARDMALSSFMPKPNDRIIFCSDGVTQAGLGSDDWRFGWQSSECAAFIKNLLQSHPGISAHDLSNSICREALSKEPGRKAKDDISCAVVYFRSPRKALLLTGPPYNHEHDAEYGRLLQEDYDSKIVAGGTTASIAARLLGAEVEVDFDTASGGLPPCSQIEGIDLVTEGILTLTRLMQYLSEKSVAHQDPAGEMARLLLVHDRIKIVVGTRINDSHQDPTFPPELVMRRNIAMKIASLLRTNYLKEVTIEFI